MCTVSVWRHLLAGGLDRREERLDRGIGALKSARNRSDGRWRRFPFWYTVSALVETNTPAARAELRYVEAVLERAARRTGGSRYQSRHRELARRALDLL